MKQPHCFSSATLFFRRFAATDSLPYPDLEMFRVQSSCGFIHINWGECVKSDAFTRRLDMGTGSRVLQERVSLVDVLQCFAWDMRVVIYFWKLPFLLVQIFFSLICVFSLLVFTSALRRSTFTGLYPQSLRLYSSRDGSHH